MTTTPFSRALDFIWGPSRDGHQDDAAPGENFATAWGVTQATWDSAVADGIVSGQLTEATRDQCSAIYRARYWSSMRLDSMSPGVALVLFNDATLTGVGHTARLLQRIVGTVQDGMIGPRTLEAVHGWRPSDLIVALIKADEAYLASLANAPKFIHGWLRREEEAKGVALQMVADANALLAEAAP